MQVRVAGGGGWQGRAAAVARQEGSKGQGRGCGGRGSGCGCGSSERQWRCEGQGPHPGHCAHCLRQQQGQLTAIPLAGRAHSQLQGSCSTQGQGGGVGVAPEHEGPPVVQLLEHKAMGPAAATAAAAAAAAACSPQQRAHPSAVQQAGHHALLHQRAVVQQGSGQRQWLLGLLRLRPPPSHLPPGLPQRPALQQRCPAPHCHAPHHPHLGSSHSLQALCLLLPCLPHREAIRVILHRGGCSCPGCLRRQRPA